MPADSVGFCSKRFFSRRSFSKYCTQGLIALVSVGSVMAQAADFDARGRVGVESRYFFEESFSSDEQSQNSVFIEPEFYWQLNDQHSITAKVFARADDLDDERSHGDLRELSWLYAGDSVEVLTGVSKVFWGVTETQHLVDIINQTDMVESVDGEEKLGQPMIRASLIRDWGTLDGFVLPYFRERTFAGPEGRLAGPIPVDSDRSVYESDKEQEHIDYALRYSHYIGDWDFGLSYFDGTNRDPYLLPAATSNPDQALVLAPYYSQIWQAGVDVQATLGEWLWKLEAIRREDNLRNVTAATGGFEYTFIGLGSSAMDLGVLAEYSYDSRQYKSAKPPQNDLFAGVRLTLNDAQSTELLFGFSQDLEESSSYTGFLEASRRLGDSVKLSVDAYLFASKRLDDPVYLFRDEDFVSIELEYFY